jgi:hypothetical protein
MTMPSANLADSYRPIQDLVPGAWVQPPLTGNGIRLRLPCARKCWRATTPNFL